MGIVRDYLIIFCGFGSVILIVGTFMASDWFSRGVLILAAIILAAVAYGVSKMDW